jgi:hypothetical protein
MDEREQIRRVEVGFSGGQAIVLRLNDGAYADLRNAVTQGGGWYEQDTPDGVVALDLRQIVFVKRDAGDHRVGFSGA